MFPAWEKAADDSVALLHVEAPRSPYSKAVTGLVGELATRSEEFRARWAAHDVKAHRRGAKLFHHPVVGDLTLRFEALSSAALQLDRDRAGDDRSPRQRCHYAVVLGGIGLGPLQPRRGHRSAS